MTQQHPIRLGTRGSALALVQSNWTAEQLRRLGAEVELITIRTTGDRIADRAFTPGDGKGVFVAEIERALLDGSIDLAVHSLKDLPAEMPPELQLAAVPAREDPRDVLVGDTAPTLNTLAPGAVVGTSSLRRRAQLLAVRPDLQVAEMRGNVDTRLRKLDEGQYDAICLAAAGLRRLGWAARITEFFSPLLMVPSVGQGALALQTRRDDARLLDLLSTLHDEPTSQAIRAERAVLAALGGGCTVPLGVLATVREHEIHLISALCSPDGAHIAREELTGCGVPEDLGNQLAHRLLARAKALGIPLPVLSTNQ